MARHKVDVLFKGADLKRKESIKRDHIADITQKCLANPQKWSRKRLRCILKAQTKHAVRRCQSW